MYNQITGNHRGEIMSEIPSDQRRDPETMNRLVYPEEERAVGQEPLYQILGFLGNGEDGYLAPIFGVG
jgi:hypothetical protein